MEARDIPQKPYIVACAYPDEEASKVVYADLVERACLGTGVSRIQAPPGRRVIAAVADDEAAGSYSARLHWGPGIPIQLTDEVCTALVERRKSGEKRAQGTSNRQFQRTGINVGINAPDEVDHTIQQLRALNTSERPWASNGGIIGANVTSYPDAAHIREIIVAEELNEMEGMIAVFGDDDAAVVAAICDTPEMCLLAEDSIARLAGNLYFQPSPQQAWMLWATRLQAGTSPLPITVQGTMQETQDYLNGSLNAKTMLHTPSRNQPCICGSGKKYKKCCGF
jgi:hypothetical protein